jgi:hypothetical protein
MQRWPSACSRLATKKRPALVHAVQLIFGLSPVEAFLRGCSSVSAICSPFRELRQRLKRHKIAIETIWGIGYRLAPAGRQRAFDMILSQSKDAVA